MKIIMKDGKVFYYNSIERKGEVILLSKPVFKNCEDNLTLELSEVLDIMYV